MMVSMTGDRELDRKLAGLPLSIQKKALRPGARAVAKNVRQTALANVPRRTGKLAKSLVVRAMKRSRRHKHQVGVSVRTREGFYQGETFYGGFVEFGTSDRQTKTGGERGRMAETRFLRNALYRFPEHNRWLFVQAIRAWSISDAGKFNLAGRRL